MIYVKRVSSIYDNIRHAPSPMMWNGLYLWWTTVINVCIESREAALDSIILIQMHRKFLFRGTYMLRQSGKFRYTQDNPFIFFLLYRYAHLSVFFSQN